VTTPDLFALADILREAAQAEIVPRFRRLDAGQVKQKSEAIDMVTEADEAAERAIAAACARLAPDALFVGEEAVAADPALLDRLDKADLAIVVDPVDGTANFAAGLPLFATMAALVRGGETIGGIIYDPMGDDWVMAERGGGAWLRRPDGSAERLSVAKAPPLAEMVGTVSVAFLPGDRARILGNCAKVRVAANYRVAGHDYRLLATGHAHFSIFGKLMPWDHLGGALIVAEAGGHVARHDGSAYRLGQRDGGLLAACSQEAWQAVADNILRA
jgi:fructose-1,6-bisphosphatase/inositol monophosphatase family enzyme